MRRVVIRDAVPPDARALYELSLPFVEGGELLARPPSYFEAHLAEFRLIEVDGRVSGCVGMHRYRDTAELYNVCVARGHHRLGLGRRLIVDALARAAAQGYGEVFLLSAVAADWFARFGFSAMHIADLPPGRACAMVPGRGSVAMRCALRNRAAQPRRLPSRPHGAWAA